MSDVFISYAREDPDWAALLAARFEARGWSVWWDRSLVAGDEFRPAIRHQLTTARAVVVLWSRDSVQSGWVLDEARLGMERGVLVPVLIDDSDIPFGFGQIQTPRLEDQSGSSLAAMSVEDSVERLVTGASPPRPGGARSVLDQQTQRRTVVAAATMSLFIAAGFWLAAARPGYLWFDSAASPLVTAGWAWVGFLIMAPALVVGAHLIGRAEPLRAAIKAFGAGFVVGSALLVAHVLTERVVNAIRGEGEIRIEYQSLIVLVVVGVATATVLPVERRGQRLGRIGVIVGAVGIALLVWGIFSQNVDLDLVAWPVAVSTPVVLVATDWATAQTRSKNR